MRRTLLAVPLALAGVLATADVGARAAAVPSGLKELSVAASLVELAQQRRPGATGRPAARPVARPQVRRAPIAARRAPVARINRAPARINRPALVRRPGAVARPIARAPIGRVAPIARGARPPFATGRFVRGRPVVIGRGAYTTTYVRRWYHRPHYGRIVAGVVLGTILVGSAYYAYSAPPAPDLCWYWVDDGHERGYWDYCSW